jgi:hypothetical protein
MITSLIIVALVGSKAGFAEYRRINVLKDRLGCAATWLEKAKSLHMAQMNDPAKFSEATMRELMDSMDSAYFCATQDPVSGHAPDAARSFGRYGVLPKDKRMEGEIIMRRIKMFLAGLLVSGLVGGGESLGAAASPKTRTHSGGGVTVKVTMLDSKTNGDLRFQVVLDTHSVNLDAYDFKTIAVLRDDNAKSYSPTAVENKGSGHHREAVLSFPKPSPETKRVELLIKDVAGVKERTFQWELQ